MYLDLITSGEVSWEILEGAVHRLNHDHPKVLFHNGTGCLIYDTNLYNSYIYIYTLSSSFIAQFAFAFGWFCQSCCRSLQGLGQDVGHQRGQGRTDLCPPFCTDVFLVAAQ